MKNHLLLITLSLISIFSIALVGVRVEYSGQARYSFLLWNLCLAWLPLLFAWLAQRWQKRQVPALAMAFLWLLFFPNAPYLVTDLIHLRAVDHVPVWYDLILLVDYALLGLFLTFISLRMMQDLVGSRFGTCAGWFFVLGALGLGGLGIFIGRFLRWNSWDLFTRPLLLLGDIWVSLNQPRTIIISGLLAMLLLFAYVIFTVAPGHGSVVQESSSGL